MGYYVLKGVYLMDPYLIWLIVAGIMFVGEIATVGFLLFWIGVGALVTMCVSFIFPEMIVLQIAIFTILSTILIILTKPLMDKLKPKEVPSNVYTILGKKATVSKTIDNTKSEGQIKIDGDIWAARSENGETINEGLEVEILKIDGVRTIVKQVKEEKILK
jgi:membrane protein implicated in regulation of membrane protease activity